MDMNLQKRAPLTQRIKTSIRTGLVRRGPSGAKGHLLPSYDYNFTPPQLLFLCQCLERTGNVPGPIVEIGCAGGRTTIFLNKFLQAMNIKKRYVCIDTFEGFTEADLAHEIEARGKSASSYGTVWKDWSRDLFAETMIYNKLGSVEVEQADIGSYDCSRLERPSFCLIDVDLYAPVKKALEKLYPRMAHGGVIVVDDCTKDNKYDGALQAYSEFVASHGLPERYHLDKLGIIEVA